VEGTPEHIRNFVDVESVYLGGGTGSDHA